MPPNSFILGWVGRNQWRKQLWVMFDVLRLLRTGAYQVCRTCGSVFSFGKRRLECCSSHQIERATPLSDVYLWMHLPNGKERGPWQLGTLEKLYDMLPGRDVHYTDGCSSDAHLSPTDMAQLYQLWDVFLFLSGGEGFGVPAWEAMSTGLPVVYTDYSSHAEFVGKACGELAVSGTMQPEPASCVFRMVAHVDEAVEAVRRIYFDRELRTTLGENGRRFVLEHGLDASAGRWHSLLSDVVGNKVDTIPMTTESANGTGLWQDTASGRQDITRCPKQL